MGVYRRINTILKFLNSHHYDSAHEIWSALSHPHNRVLTMEHLFDLSCCVDEKEKLFIYGGRDSVFDESVISKKVYMIPLPEDLADKVYEALQGVALKKIDSEYVEEENKERERKKRNYLNQKLFGPSISLIMEMEE